jgi:hypothetical protein
MCPFFEISSISELAFRTFFRGKSDFRGFLKSFKCVSYPGSIPVAANASEVNVRLCIQHKYAHACICDMHIKNEQNMLKTNACLSTRG